MAYYAKISNEEFTVSERARLMEAQSEKSAIEANNRASEEYATLKTAYEDSFTSSTLQTLEGELAVLQAQGTPEMTKEERDYTQDQEVWRAEVETIQVQIRAKIEEMNAIPKVEKDNTVYWEGYYGGCKRTSYNTRAGVHQLGGTPFRKNYAGVGYIYDPVRDAFYVEQPYSSWVLNEDSCEWEAPTPKPEGIWYWSEAIVGWTEYPNKPFKSWTYENKIPSWNGYYAGDETINDWFAPSECPDALDLSLEKPISSYIWDEENLIWIDR
jgi:hypothetical protein